MFYEKGKILIMINNIGATMKIHSQKMKQKEKKNYSKIYVRN